jgi:hypothetical protein
MRMAGLLVLLSALAAFQAHSQGLSVLVSDPPATLALFEGRTVGACPPGVPPLLPPVRLNEVPLPRLQFARQVARPGLEIFEPPCVGLLSAGEKR